MELTNVSIPDGTALDAYKLNDGAKLHLMLKENNADVKAVAAKPKKAPPVDMEEELSRALRNHFRNEDEAKRVARAFKRGLRETLSKMNVDDVERFCRNFNATGTIKF